MARYLPGVILAAFGVVAYVIGCIMYVAYRREKDPARKNKPLMIYVIAMIVLGIIAFGGGLYTLEINEIRVLSH
jgi:FtsH-binding integral membrane protein